MQHDHAAPCNQHHECGMDGISNPSFRQLRDLGDALRRHVGIFGAAVTKLHR